jgi:DNA polymerase
MTADEKMGLAHLLYTAGDYLRDGFRLSGEKYSFSDDEAFPPDTPLPGIRAAVPVSADSLETVAAEIRECTGCPLHGERKNAVPGEGVTQPLVLVIGEGPGADEDASGRPFVGKAGQLLDKMLAAVGLSREKNCFIANMVKCRPPNNRDPLPEEMAPCSRFLTRQIGLLNPKVILCLGRISTQTLLKTGISLGSLRGSFASYHAGDTPQEVMTIPLLPTYHPSAILRDESYKRPAWEDLKLLRQTLIEKDPDYALEAGEGEA